MSDNPLSTNRNRPADAAPHPMMRHAELWQHVNKQTPEILQQHADTMDHVLPALAKLAGDPDVTAKDVIKAVTSAVAAGAIAPSTAVSTISDMPADPDKLRPWLKDRYATALAVTVHAKAALQQRAMAAAGIQPGTTGTPPGAVPTGGPGPGPAVPVMPQGAPPGVPVQ